MSTANEAITKFQIYYPDTRKVLYPQRFSYFFTPSIFSFSWPRRKAVAKLKIKGTSNMSWMGEINWQEDPFCRAGPIFFNKSFITDTDYQSYTNTNYFVSFNIKLIPIPIMVKIPIYGLNTVVSPQLLLIRIPIISF